jgi:5-(carboxyamino)imidazole ribonucleotide mutase
MDGTNMTADERSREEPAADERLREEPTAGAARTDNGPSARVGVIMGSDSDWSVMEDAVLALAEFDVRFEVGVVSAHRTPDRMLDYARNAAGRGIEVIIAGAGGAAHLPGMVASATPLPVIGVPVPLARLDGMDSLLSIVQMPAGVPVATVSIGGARNAGLLAVRILASADPTLRARMERFQADLEAMVLRKDAALRDRLLGDTSGQGKVTGE